jgi:hypothetical protein
VSSTRNLKGFIIGAALIGFAFASIGVESRAANTYISALLLVVGVVGFIAAVEVLWSAWKSGEEDDYQRKPPSIL